MTANTTYPMPKLEGDHTTILYYDECATELREKSERFKKLTDIIWAELTYAYGLSENTATFFVDQVQADAYQN